MLAQGSWKWFFILVFTSLALGPFLYKLDSLRAQSAEETQKVVLTLYSERNTQLLKPVLEAYKDDHPWVSFRVHTDKAPSLIEKLKQKSSYADVLITVDVGHLVYAQKEKLLRALEKKGAISEIPSYLKDEKGFWFGVSLRARPIFYNPERVKPEQIKSYENLANPYFKGKLCLRTSKKVYNQSLVAFFLAAWGEERTKRVLRAWVHNLAAKVFTSDTLLLKAIASGQCDLGVANSYYYARLLKKDPSFNVRVFWPQDDLGAHVNISGAAFLKKSKQAKEATSFLNWLASKKAQKVFSDANLEYPVSGLETSHELVRAFSHNMKVNSDHSLKKIGSLQPQALHLIYDVKYE